jgi:hypothetical protein
MSKEQEKMPEMEELFKSTFGKSLSTILDDYEKNLK